MTTIAFIGLGNMGNPMAANLVKAGHRVQGFDLMPENLSIARDNGVSRDVGAAGAVDDAEVVITMLPAGKHVVDVYRRRRAARRSGHAFHRLLDGRYGICAPGPRDRLGQGLAVQSTRRCQAARRARWRAR